MNEYSRPYIEPMVFRDNSGRVINYGNRWADKTQSQRESSCEMVTHPERFSPLHTVATALSDYLISTYDVTVEEGYSVTTDLLHPPPARETVKAVRLTPNREGCASLVLIQTDFPGVLLYAGVLFNEVLPSCGCDGCDESWEDCANDLEWETFAIVNGNLTEEIGKRRPPKLSYSRGIGFVKGLGQPVSYQLRSSDGDSEAGEQSRAKDLPKPMLKNARNQLKALKQVSPDGNWLPWPKLGPATHDGSTALD